jgi:metal-responsive CopG/Arc/MetJ family transcriptional regulator
MYTPKHERAGRQVLETNARSLSNQPANPMSDRSSVVSVRLESSVKSALDSCASSLGISRSEVVARCIETGLEALRSQGGVAPRKIEESLRGLSEIRRVFFGVSGPFTMGILHLLARWAAEIGRLKVPEGELLDEVWAIGANEWEQAVEESEPSSTDRMGEAPEERFRVEPEPKEARVAKQRMPKPDVRFDPDLLRRVDAFAQTEGITRSRAVRELCGTGLDTVESRKGIPHGRVDEILEAIESEKRLMAPLGAATLGILHLLVHWAAQTGGLRVSEDELFAEVRTVGYEEWERISEESTRLFREARAEGER